MMQRGYPCLVLSKILALEAPMILSDAPTHQKKSKHRFTKPISHPDLFPLPVQKEIHQITVNAAPMQTHFQFSNQRPANHPNIIDASLELGKQS